MAYPSKLTPELQTQLCKLIAAGSPPAVAAQASGIAEGTFYAWMRRAESNRKADLRYRNFKRAVELASAESEAILVTRIAKAASAGSWSAAAWILERRWPQRWSKPADRPQERGDHEPADPFAALDELAPRREARPRTAG
jgi:transposase